MSYHDFEETPDDETLQLLLAAMRGAGCHVAKIAAMATDISDSMRMLKLLDQETGDRSAGLLCCASKSIRCC